MRLFILSLLLCFSASIFANEAATVVAIRGDVQSQNGILKQGSHVFEHDSIVTSEGSFVILQFTDGSKVTVRPNSELRVNAYVYGEENENAEFELISGGLRILTGALAKSDPESYKLRTPVALMGVRGTEFSIMLVESVPFD